MWRVLVFELILLLVVVGVWLLAPLVGIKSVLWRVLIILVLLLPPIVLVIWKFLSQRKAAGGLEKAMKEQGRLQQDSVRPDRRDEIKVLNDAFTEAVASLKKSRLGGGRGTALYAFPWYMIIGPPAAGKSTALLQSGLNFPHTTGERKAIKGVGGTRNCDWWFSDRAILLDTAGRYTSEDDDMDEWTAFLRMLKRYRKHRPLNGLLVAVSIADVIDAKPHELDELAQKVRSRIDHVISELDLIVPVYILMTKCDLLSGFVEFFGDMKKKSRSQIFGFTVPLTSATTDIEELFDEEFNELADRLRERGLIRLTKAKSQDRSAVFQFPLQFDSVYEPVKAFLTQVLVANPYSETPRLRGVYFCSGTQEGRPMDRVMSMMGNALGVKEATAPSLAQKVTKKSYFLADVFTRVIFPDRKLAGTTAVALRRRKRLSIAGLIASAALSAGIVSVALVTFFNNNALVTSTMELAKESRVTTPDDPRDVTDSLRALERLGNRLDTFEVAAKSGTPWSLGFGFYQGNQIHLAAQKVYIKRMKRAFVRPAGSELEATLEDIGASKRCETGSSGSGKPVEESMSDFDLLKAYLMVTERSRLKVDFVNKILVEQWKKRLHPDVAKESDLLERNAKRYLRLRKAEAKAEWLEQKEETVRKVRQALRSCDTEYRRLIEDANKQLPAFTLRAALRGRIQTVLQSKFTVPGAYTQKGWKDYVRRRIAQSLVSGSNIEPWVLGEEGTKDVAARLRSRYYEEYIFAWRRFLTGISVAEQKTAQDSLTLLERLTEPPEPYRDLFIAVAINTDFSSGGSGKGPPLPKKLKGYASKAKKYGLDEAARNATRGDLNPVERTFLPLRELVIPPKGLDGQVQVSGLKQYLDQLNKIREELALEVKAESPGESDGVKKALETANRITKGVLITLSGDLRRLVKPLFYAPLDSVGINVKIYQQGQSSKKFNDDVCAIFDEKLHERFPFDKKSKRDALLQDVTEFFSSEGTVWTFFNTSLKKSLRRKGDKFTAAPGTPASDKLISFITQSWRISRGLFPKGAETPRLKFEARPRPAIIAEGSKHLVSEIILEVEDKSNTYRNGPIEQWALEWTGEGQRSRIVVKGDNNLQEEIAFQGPWALLRLIREGKVRKRGSWYQVEWSFKGKEIRIPIDLRPSRTYNLLFDDLELSCQ